MSIESVMFSNYLSSPALFSSCLQCFPAPGSFPVSQFFASSSQSPEASASVLIMNIQGWFPFGLISLISLQFKGLSSLLQHHSLKVLILQCSAFLMVQLSHPYMTTRKIIALTVQTFVGKVMSLLFNMLSRFVIAFLPRSKCLLISCLQSISAVILEPKKIKSVTVFPLFLHLFSMKWWDQMPCHGYVFPYTFFKMWLKRIMKFTFLKCIL